MPRAAICPSQSGRGTRLPAGSRGRRRSGILAPRPLALTAILALVAGFILPGCTHYRLGTGSELAFHSLYIEPVASEALLPQARALVGTELREAFLRDGRVALANSAEAAEATLHVSLKSYDRAATVARTDDTGLARKFALALTAECTLRTRDGKVLFEKRIVQARRDAYADQGQLSAEYQTLPLLAETLAQDVTHAVLDVW
jgi:outer membrane lipopolysaccharide assembly protein LptE/RlpB